MAFIIQVPFLTIDTTKRYLIIIIIQVPFLNTDHTKRHFIIIIIQVPFLNTDHTKRLLIIIIIQVPFLATDHTKRHLIIIFQITLGLKNTTTQVHDMIYKWNVVMVQKFNVYTNLLIYIYIYSQISSQHDWNNLTHDPLIFRCYNKPLEM